MFCAVIVLLFTLGNAQFPDFCFQPSSVTEGDVSFDRDGTKGTIKATSALIALNETLCYKVKLRTPEGEIERLYAVKYVGAEQYYGFKIGYNFSIPVIDTQCVCACPASKGVDCAKAWDGCDRDLITEIFQESAGTCFVVSATGQTPEGCVWIGGEATTCCQVIISPDANQRATVVQLSTMEPRLLFNVTVLDLTNRRVVKTEHSLPLVDSELGVPTGLDEYYKIMIKLDGRPKNVISPGEYILYNDKVYHFLGNSLNGLDDYDMSKIGWYKEGENGRIDVMRIKDKVQRAMKIRTLNCGSSSIDIEFNGRYYNTRLDVKNRYQLADNLVPLEHYYAPEIKELVVNSEFHSRYVHLTQESSRRVSVDFILRQMYKGSKPEDSAVVDTAWLNDLSKLSDFKATIVKDQYGNNVLSIELTGAVGEIIGQIEGGVQEDLTIIVPTLQETFLVKQEVVTACKPGIWIRLKTASTETITRNVSCESRTGKIFKAPYGHLFHKKMEDFNYLKMGTWASSGNPANWFDGKYEHGELIAALVYLIAIAIIVRFTMKNYRKFQSIGTAQTKDDKRWPKYGKRMKMKMNRLTSESEGLEEFKGMKDVGYSKSMEDMLNDGSRSEDWNHPRMHGRGSSL